MSVKLPQPEPARLDAGQFFRKQKPPLPNARASSPGAADMFLLVAKLSARWPCLRRGRLLLERPHVRHKSLGVSVGDSFGRFHQSLAIGVLQAFLDGLDAG